MIAALNRISNGIKAATAASGWLEGATPHRVIWTRGPAKIRRYEPEAATGSPVVLVMPFINRFRLADLEPRSSLVGHLVAAGHPVTLVDWGEPRRIDQGLDFEDYVLKVIPKAVELAGAGEPVHIMGICLGGTLSTMFAARFPQRVRSLVTLVAPVDFTPMAEMRNWVQPEHFPVEQLTGAFGNMPGWLVSQGFDNLRPASVMLKYQRAFERFEDYDFAEQFMVIESWNRDNVNVPGAIYRRLICDLYRDNKLFEGRFELAGQALDLSDIRCPVMVLAAGGDLICRSEAAKALLDKVGAPRKDYHELRGGHIASIVGPRAQQHAYPLLTEWFA